MSSDGVNQIVVAEKPTATAEAEKLQSTPAPSHVESSTQPHDQKTQQSIEKPPISSEAAAKLSSPMDIDLSGVRIDRWGQLMDVKDVKQMTEAERKARKLQIERDTERELKWVKMLKKWDQVKYEKIKRRVRKGIPDSLRAAAWVKFTGADKLKKSNGRVYHTLLDQESAFSATIRRDLHRTFPNHVYFRISADGTKHGLCEPLYRVLNAYALFDKEVGYCQGMAFLAGIFLLYLSEEDTFWMLNAIMRGQNYYLAGLYMEGFPLLKQFFFQFSTLMKEQCPKLHTHMEAENLPPELYATQWFITLFTYSLPFEFVLRIWDILLHEGVKIIFKIALYFIRTHEKKMLLMDFQEMVLHLREAVTQAGSLDVDVFLNDVLQVPLSRAKLDSLSRAYMAHQFKQGQPK